MRYLLDTGILLRLPHRPDALHETVRHAVRTLRLAGHTFVTTRQNIGEFWNVSTRSALARGGLGLSIAETDRRLRMLERRIRVLREPEKAYDVWKRLIVAHKVSGVQVHDARIVALMTASRIRRILTLNPADFGRYTSIVAVTPQSLAGAGH